MADSVPALVAGGLLILLALGSVWFLRQRYQSVVEPDEQAQAFAARQYRRRLQVAGMLGLIGILIPLGDALPLFRQAPVAFFFYWMAVLLLTAWMVLLALADMASARAHFGSTGRKLQQQQRELEAEIRRIRASRNGSQIHSDE